MCIIGDMATAIAANQRPTRPPQTSASGVLALLDENDNQLKTYALECLYNVVDQFWAEIADAIPEIESLAEDESFPSRELAAAVASRCFFHLEEYSDALRLALGAGKYFDVAAKNEYTETIIAKCFDEYIAIRTDSSKEENSIEIDPRMEAIVEKMFQRCYADRTYSQALGVALEARRLDKVEEVILQADDTSKMLKSCYDLCQNVVEHRVFRLKVVEILVKIYRTLTKPDYTTMCLCLQFLDDAQSVVTILEKLARQSEADALTAYQVAFDLSDNENQKFLMNILEKLPTAPGSSPESNTSTSTEGQAGQGPASAAGTEGNQPPSSTSEAPTLPPPPPPAGAHGDYWTRISNLRRILDGSFTVDLMLNFLYRQHNTDMLILKNLKTAVENRNSVLHGATVVTHGYMQAGTTIDSFLRDNLEWMGRATNWAKFTATAGIGVVHKGHVKQSMTLLQPYLPQGGVSASPYSEGGALYALGLIHANKGGSGHNQTITYLQEALRNAGTNETVQHGACLGLGLAAMATGDEEIYEDLKNTLYTDSAVAGEAAGYAIGLVLLGRGNSTELSRTAVAELLAYAHDTKHEKIIRAAAMGVALIMYGREEEADVVIEQMSRDKDHIVRYGGMYATSLAYVGTGSNSAIRRLLHVSVSDVSDDVRRAAVTCLGFVLFRSSEQVPKLVSLLAESFNPHVRYGACIAVGISCAGTAKQEAISLLEPMLDDAVDYVRQGAMIAMAMVLMQEAEARTPKVKAIREKLSSIVSDKHQSTMTKMGAIIATGIIDAGGRNVVLAMQSRAGVTRMTAVVGMVFWAQYWFWYPLMHFLSLAFQPTTLVGLNNDLKMPKSFSVKCNARPSLFEYPKKLEEKKEEKKKLVTTAVLSTTAKAKAKQARQEKKEGKSSEETQDDQMDVESQKNSKETTEAAEDSKDAEKEKEKEKEKEPRSFVLTHPARLTLAQEKFVAFRKDERYIPVMEERNPVGIVMLRDTKPEEEEEILDMAAPTAGQADDEEEADPPEPFEWEPPQ